MTDKYKSYWKFAGVVAILILFYCILQNFHLVTGLFSDIFSILFPLILGCCIAFVLNIPMSWMEKLFNKSQKKWVQKIKRPVSILVSIGFVIALVYLIVSLVVPEVLKGIKVLMASITDALNKFEIWWSVNHEKHPELHKFLIEQGIDINNLQESITNKVQSWSPTIITNLITIVTTSVSAIISFLMALFFALYLLMGKEKLKNQSSRLIEACISKKAESGFMHVCSVTYQTFSKFVVGQCTEAIILGSLCALGMLILRMPYAAMVGALVGVTALIPIVGAFLGAGVGAFMIAMVNPMQALGFLIFLLILQQVEGNIIYPRVVGSSVGLPPIWVFAAVMVGGGIGGLVGMLFAVPVTSVCYKLIKEQVQKKEAMKGLSVS